MFARLLPSKKTLRGHSDSSFRGEGYIQCCVGVRLCDMYQELAEIHFMYERGYFETAMEMNNGNLYVRWMDNTAVTMISTSCGTQEITHVKKFSQKRNVMVPKTKLVAKYNSYMYGTDQIEQKLSCYHIGIWGKKMVLAIGYLFIRCCHAEQLDHWLATPPWKKSIAQKPKEGKAGWPNLWRHGKNKANDLKIGTWNVLSLYRPGALKVLTDQLLKYKVDVTAIQEMRWMGNGVIDKKECVIFYSCHPNKHQFGTGFIVRKEVKHLILNFNPINERISVLRIKGKFFNCSLINVHAPTEMKPNEEKDTFYALLERAFDSCPSSDIKMVLGDLNAQVGKEEIYYPTIGKYSLHDSSNDNGQRLIEFATSRGMVIGGTFYCHKAIHKGTWKMPDGNVVNQIDHMVIDKRHKKCLLDIRNRRGA
ncbi:hypothetical protein ANN_17681 [Periplaneta americana]|uniref:Endonuclease/exonuclease/phosphatase domain-containing protein n=1 Tax=Periplaneta americana TaxID=6978 RepID=A0ABQ8SUY4_PERAM|nr:hypothetical protein ANN_17681 [Periplaneta americana]